MEASLLKASLVGLILQGALGEEEEGEELEIGHAELILRIGEGLDEGSDVTIADELLFLIKEHLLYLEEGFLIMAAHLPQEVLFLTLLVLEVPQALVVVLLQDLELLQQLLVLAIQFSRRTPTHLILILNKITSLAYPNTSKAS